MPGKSGRSLIFWGRVLYAHSTISSKLFGFVASAMGQLYHQDKRRDVDPASSAVIRALRQIRQITSAMPASRYRSGLDEWFGDLSSGETIGERECLERYGKAGSPYIIQS